MYRCKKCQFELKDVSNLSLSVKRHEFGRQAAYQSDNEDSENDFSYAYNDSNWLVCSKNRAEVNTSVDVHLAASLVARPDHALPLSLQQLVEKLREHVLVDHPMLPHDRRHELLLVLRPRMRNVDPKPRSQHIKPPSRVPQLRQKLHFVVPIIHKPLVKSRHSLRLFQNNIRLLLVLHEAFHQR